MGDEPDRRAPQAWIDALARSEEDLAGGRVVPWSAVREELVTLLPEMEAKQARRSA